jgi:hypothetical protein
VNEVWNLGGIGRAVGVNRDDDVAARSPEPRPQRGTLAESSLLDDSDVRQELTRDRHGVVRRGAVDQDHLIDECRDPGQDVRQVPLLVQRRYDDADPGSWHLRSPGQWVDPFVRLYIAPVKAPGAES